eukprot:g1704.t1
MRDTLIRNVLAQCYSVAARQRDDRGEISDGAQAASSVHKSHCIDGHAGAMTTRVIAAMNEETIIDIDEEEVDEGGEKEKNEVELEWERASAASLGVPTYELNDDDSGTSTPRKSPKRQGTFSKVSSEEHRSETLRARLRSAIAWKKAKKKKREKKPKQHANGSRVLATSSNEQNKNTLTSARAAADSLLKFVFDRVEARIHEQELLNILDEESRREKILIAKQKARALGKLNVHKARDRLLAGSFARMKLYASARHLSSSAFANWRQLLVKKKKKKKNKNKNKRKQKKASVQQESKTEIRTNKSTRGKPPERKSCDAFFGEWNCVNGVQMRTKKARNNAGPHAKPHGQSRANVKSKMKSKMESKMKSKMKSKVKSKVKQKATKTGEKNTKAQAISLTKTRIKVHAKTQSKAQARSQARSQSKAQSKARAKARAKAHTQIPLCGRLPQNWEIRAVEGRGEDWERELEYRSDLRFGDLGIVVPKSMNEWRVETEEGEAHAVVTLRFLNSFLRFV